MINLPPQQLRMAIDAAPVGQMPDVPLPTGYVARAYRPGDSRSWTDTLRQGGFTDWNVEKVLAYLENPERREGSCLIAHDGQIVAATFASRVGNQPYTQDRCGKPSDTGVLDFVVTHPDHRGKGLGKATCTEVARFLVARGCKTVELHTDDWRFPAIHVYLSLGFRPVMNRSDMPERWAAVIEKLKESGRDHT